MLGSRELRTDGALVTAEPRYATIKNYILEAVAAGKLRPGDKVPSEHEFGVMFDVSRMTVNRALRELKSDGVLVGVAGVGSFIAEPKPQGQLIKVRNIADEIRARGHEYSANVIQNASEKASRPIATHLGAAPGTAIFHSIIVHNEAGTPIQLEERYVLAAAAPDYGSIDFSATTPNEYLMRVAPLERVVHKVRAVMPDARARELLMMKEGEPCLLVVRQTWSQSRIVSYAQLLHPGPRFEFSDTFEP